MKALIFSLLGLSSIQLTSAYDKEALGNWFVGLKPEKVVYAVNCGSIDSLTDMLGVTYQAVFSVSECIIG